MNYSKSINKTEDHGIALYRKKAWKQKMISIDTNLKTRFERSWSKGRGRCKTWGVFPPVCLIQNAERESVYLETHLRSKNQLHHAFRLLCLHVKKGSNLSQSAIVCPAFIRLATIQNKFQSWQKAFLKILLFITTFRSDFFSPEMRCPSCWCSVQGTSVVLI